MCSCHELDDLRVFTDILLPLIVMRNSNSRTIREKAAHISRFRKAAVFLNSWSTQRESVINVVKCN